MGGNLGDGYGQWWRQNEGGIIFSTNQFPYDWWTAFSENMGTLKSYQRGTAQPFTQVRILRFLYDLVIPTFRVDTNRILLGGFSMGGSGTSMWGIRSGHIFSHTIAWVGVHSPKESPYGASFIDVFGDSTWHVLYSNEALGEFGYHVVSAEDSIRVWDYWSNMDFLAENPTQETPWMTYSNGSNDNSIGWPQAWKYTQAMIQTKRSFNFTWGTSGHSQTAWLIDGNTTNSGLDFRKNQSLPAFTNCSIDGDLGSNYSNSSLAGTLNRYFKWDVSTVVDESEQWNMTIWLIDVAAYESCTVNITPRRLQNLEHGPNSTYHWELTDQEGYTLLNGNAITDSNGLFTILTVPISKTKRTLKVSCISCTSTSTRIIKKSYQDEFIVETYPNPFNPVIHIKIRNSNLQTQQAQFNIYDIAGKCVLAGTSGHGKTVSLQNGINADFRWDASNQPSGVYILKIFRGDKSTSKKILLLR